jgi:lipopolysaccharide/colanic/teichoic acid biosynthesis glycosyltransferase
VSAAARRGGWLGFCVAEAFFAAVAYGAAARATASLTHAHLSLAHLLASDLACTLALCGALSACGLHDWRVAVVDATRGARLAGALSLAWVFAAALLSAAHLADGAVSIAGLGAAGLTTLVLRRLTPLASRTLRLEPRVFLIGEGPMMRRVAREIARAGRADVVGFAGPRTRELGRRVVEAGIETVVLAVEDGANPALRVLLCHASPSIEIASVDEYCEHILGKIAIDPAAPHLLPAPKRAARTLADVARSACSRLCALVILLLLAPLTLACAALLWLGGEGPALAREPRVGRRGRPFSLVTPAATWAGRRLRALRLDRLPALWNVLRGDLCLVGPRARSPQAARDATRLLPSSCDPTRVRPGLFSWCGAPSASPASEPADTLHALGLDLYYLRHRSLWLDLRILWRALGSAATSRGV